MHAPRSIWVEINRVHTTARGLSAFTTLAAIRHPCSRFVSAFNYLMRREGTSARDNEWTTKHIGPGTSGAAEHTKTIDQFVAYLQRGADPSLWESATGVNHFKPMHKQLFFKNGSFGIDVVVCQEDWQRGIERLQAARPDLKMPDELISGHAKRSHYNSSVNHYKHTCAELEPQTRAAIEEHYKLDYCIFGYTLEPPSPGGSEGARASAAACGTPSREEYTRQMEKCKQALLG